MSEDTQITGIVSNETAAAVFTLLREDIATLRDDNRQQHKEIVHRLDTINGRVHRHDREIADVQSKTATLKDIQDTVHHIDQNYLSKKIGWTAFTTVVGGMVFALFWLLERVFVVPQ